MEIIVEEISKQVLPFIAQLEWLYIILIVMICKVLLTLEYRFRWNTLFYLKKRYKVAIFGALFAPVYYTASGMDKNEIGILFASYIVSFVFHKLIAEAVIKKLMELSPYYIEVGKKEGDTE